MLEESARVGRLLPLVQDEGKNRRRRTPRPLVLAPERDHVPEKLEEKPRVGSGLVLDQDIDPDRTPGSSQEPPRQRQVQVRPLEERPDPFGRNELQTVDVERLPDRLGKKSPEKIPDERDLAKARLEKPVVGIGQHAVLSAGRSEAEKPNAAYYRKGQDLSSPRLGGMPDTFKDYSHEKAIHVILDNPEACPKNEDWLSRHPNVTFHFTPTSASWLNQVEIWFGILSRKALAGASFPSRERLIKALQNFMSAYNQMGAQFVWRKREVKGAQLRNTIANLCN